MWVNNWSFVPRGEPMSTGYVGLGNTILLCLPTTREVRHFIRGPGARIEHARPGTIFIDPTSGDPPITSEITAALKGTGVELVDAPISGASPEQYARLHPILTDVSGNVLHAGPLGPGHRAKLANNMLSACKRLASMEAIALAARNGLDPRVLSKSLTSAASQCLDQAVRPERCRDKACLCLTLGLSHKDIRLACQLGIETDVPPPKVTLPGISSRWRSTNWAVTFRSMR